MLGFFGDNVVKTGKILYLFTASDLISTMLPNIVYGITLPLSSHLLRIPATPLIALRRLPLTILWVWCNLLLFDMSNQSQPESVREDQTNKPWRPIPSDLLSIRDTRKYARLVKLGVLGLSLSFNGGFYPTVVLLVLTYLYNDLKGSEHWLPRNMLNAGGYLSFAIGAMEVAVGFEHLEFTNKGWRWMIWTSVIISCTVHIQDIYDQRGDNLRRRRTIPLVFGDAIARYSIVFFVTLWSTFSATYWPYSRFGFILTVYLGGVVIARLMRNVNKNLSYDKKTFVYWTVWLISIQLLPLSA